MIYFDNNATTRLDERVLDAMLPFLRDWYGNPSALYRLGRTARSAVETARSQVAALVGATEEQVVFTSGGTESNNLALHQIASGAMMVVSAIEHPSVMVPAEHWQSQGNRLQIAGVDVNGLVDLNQIQSIKWHSGDLLSLQLANNETGVIQNFAQLAEFLSEQGVIIHTDAVQAVGKIPVDFSKTHAHMLSISSHKLYGPKGCGALIVKPGFFIRPVLSGGGQERDSRSGTENVAAIIGFGKAAELALSERGSRLIKLNELRNYLEQAIRQLPGAVIFSDSVARLPNTVQWGMPDMDGEMLLMQLDRKGIAVSSGSACSSGAGMPSEVLTAMGVPENLAKSALRISLGYHNSFAEIDTFMQQIYSLTQN